MGKKKSKKTVNGEDRSLLIEKSNTVLISVKRLVPPRSLSNIILSSKQSELVNSIDKNEITIVTGPAGTSKTFIDCYYIILPDLTMNKAFYKYKIEDMVGVSKIMKTKHPDSVFSFTERLTKPGVVYYGLPEND